MITKINGKLVGLSDTEATLEVGAFEYEVYVPEFVRRQLQTEIGQSISLRTIEYLEGNPQKGRMTPRMVGFISDAEREMAATLVDQLTRPFDPTAYSDDYRVALEGVIEAKLGSGAPVAVAAPTARGEVKDLMEALRASIETAKATREGAA